MGSSHERRTPRNAVKPASEERAATEKRARTRRLVLRAAADCIAEKGVAEATAAEIARRCDLSWGVIQYHFGDRLGLLLALLERSAEALARAFADLESTHPLLPDRVRALVEGTWALVTSDHYRVLLEIELQLGREAAHEAQVRRYARQARSRFLETWRKALPECPPRRVDEAAQLAMAALRGLALERAIEGTRSSEKEPRAIALRSVLDILDLDDA
jgi:AcrR family transcriptional regulator